MCSAPLRPEGDPISVAAASRDDGTARPPLPEGEVETAIAVRVRGHGLCGGACRAVCPAGAPLTRSAPRTRPLPPGEVALNRERGSGLSRCSKGGVVEGQEGATHRSPAPLDPAGAEPAAR